jgi:uncharacterized protein (DUF1330 family)
MSSVMPTHDQLARFIDDAAADDGPVTMVNLLRFEAKSGSGPGSDGAGSEAGDGAAEYDRYAAQAVKMVEATGGRLVWVGKVDQVFIGTDERDGWDAVAVVEYPNRQAFLDMVARPDYQQAHEHREAGLAATALLATTTLQGGKLAD